MKTITFSEAAETLGCSRQYVHYMKKTLGIEPRVVNSRLSFLGKADIQQMKRFLDSNKKD